MKDFKPKKFSSLKRAFIAAILVVFLTFSPLAAPKTDAWMAIPSVMIKQLMENIFKYIEDTIVAVLKQAGGQVVSQLSTKLIMGGDSGPLVITNWENYLLRGSEKSTQVIMNDMLSASCRGRNSSSGYRPAPGSEGIGSGMFNWGVGTYANYCTRVTEAAKASLVSSSMPRPTYEGNPANALAGRNMYQQSQMYSGSNPAGAQLMAAASEQNRVYEEQKEIRKLEATSSGYLPKKDARGNVIAPADTVRSTIGSSLNIGNQMLAQANTIPGVLTALAVQLVTQTFTKGVGNLASKATKEVTGVQNQAQAQKKAQINTNGPGTLYKR